MRTAHEREHDDRDDLYDESVTPLEPALPPEPQRTVDVMFVCDGCGRQSVADIGAHVVTNDHRAVEITVHVDKFHCPECRERR